MTNFEVLRVIKRELFNATFDSLEYFGSCNLSKNNYLEAKIGN